MGHLMTKTIILGTIIAGIIISAGITMAYAGNEIKLAGTVNTDGNQVKNVGAPTDDADAATKSYVDSNSGIEPATQAQIDNIETLLETLAAQSLTQILVQDYVGLFTSAPFKGATSDRPFILHVCAENDDPTLIDEMSLGRMTVSTPEIMAAEIDGGKCLTVGGLANEKILYKIQERDGNTRATVTLITSADATASIDP